MSRTMKLGQNGAAVVGENGHCNEFLIQAAKEGSLSQMERLFREGAIVNRKNSRGRTALHVASCSGHLEVVAFLVENGAQVNGTSDAIGRTALHYACNSGHLKVATFLLENGASDRAISFKTSAGIDRWKIKT